jgi:arsenate reductase-like glutaredoxin family protein
MASENAELKSTIAEMKKMMEEFMTSKSQEVKEVVKYIEVDKTPEIIDIPLNRVVKVMSLFRGVMTLKTQANGGKEILFNSFGTIQPIIYSDLLQIMSHQQRFCDEGYFVILDKDVVIANGKEDLYKQFLDKKQIENILSYDDETITSLFSNTTKNIKESIVAILVSKINSNESIDKNKVHLISDIYGTDLFAYARGDVEVLVNSKIV